MALTPFFNAFFNHEGSLLRSCFLGCHVPKNGCGGDYHEGCHRQNQESRVLGKIAYHLPCCFEKEAHNRANEPGQHRTNFCAHILKTVSQGFAGGFKACLIEPTTAPAVRKIAATVSPYFLKISFIFFKRGRALSLYAI